MEGEERREGMTISKIIDLLEWAEDRTNELSDGLATCKSNLKKLSHSDDEDWVLHHVLSEKGGWHD